MSNKMDGLPLKRNCDLLTELIIMDELQDASAAESSPMDVPMQFLFENEDSYLVPG